MSNAKTVPARPSVPRSAWVMLFTGVVAVSMSAILIRYAQAEGVPSLIIAAFRLTFATLILTPMVLPRYQPQLRLLTRRDWLLMGTAGVFLALHFATWITSLEHTSVLVATVLVTTSPIWVCGLEVIFLKTRLNRWIILGLVVCMAGGLLIALGGTGGTGANPLLGGTLSLVGAMTVAVYMVIGRSVRSRLALLPYIYVVYGFAALTLIIIGVFSGQSFTGYSVNAHVLMLLMAIFPQLIGHSSFNYAVKFLPATYIGIVTQMEPIASAALAFVLLREQPGVIQILASGLILFGVACVVLSPPPTTTADIVAEAEAL